MNIDDRRPPAMSAAPAAGDHIVAHSNENHTSQHGHSTSSLRSHRSSFDFSNETEFHPGRTPAMVARSAVDGNA
jgi:hypothetical protein